MDWTGLFRDLNELLRLRTFPIAVKYLSRKKTVKGGEKPEGPRNVCQLMAMARIYGKSIYFTADDMACVVGAVCLGLYPETKPMKTGEIAETMYKDRYVAKKFVEAVPKIKYGKFKAVAIAPINQDEVVFKPDQLIIYANTAQADRILQGLKFETGRRFEFSLGGEYGVCCDAMAQCYIKKSVAIAIPCWGDRLHAMALDDELIIAIPWNLVEKMRQGIKNSEQPGFCSYPVQYTGINHAPIHDLPDFYLTDKALRFKREGQKS